MSDWDRSTLVVGGLVVAAAGAFMFWLFGRSPQAGGVWLIFLAAVTYAGMSLLQGEGRSMAGRSRSTTEAPVGDAAEAPPDSNTYAVVLAALQESLASEGGDWVEESLQRLRGPGSVGVILENTHTEDWHVDVGLQLNRERPDAPILWDCIAVDPQNPEAAVQASVARWRATTFAVMKEFTLQSGRFATHIDGHDPDGIPGWHAIHSPLWGWGTSSAEPMGEWLVEHPLLPAFAQTCLPRLDRPDLNTLKVVFGGGVSRELVEVRINGSFIEAASDAVLELAWPRIEATWVWAYILLFRQPDHA